MPFFLGIDGGGTRTTAWLADERGRVVGRAAAGPSNPIKVGFAACQREILRAARAAVAQGSSPAASLRRVALKGGAARSTSRRGGLRNPPLQAVVVGLAGVDRAPVHRRISSWLRHHIPAHRHLLSTDAAIALAAALGNTPGVIVISGTGSIAYARDARGRVQRAGGWGSLYDDVGSGYDLGSRAVAAALHDFDGRGPHTQLTKRLCGALRLKKITEIVLHPLDAQQMAALFPLVVNAAQRRDRVAGQLLQEAGEDLSALALALLRRLNWTRRAVPVVCTGGVFHSSPEVRRSFARALRRRAPRARVSLLRREPVEGALALARQSSPSH